MVLRDRNLIIGLSFWPVSADSSYLFSDAFGPRDEKLNGKQAKFSGKYHQIESPGGYSNFFRICRLGPSIYCSPPKNIRNFKHPKKIFEILATQKNIPILYIDLKKRPSSVLPRPRSRENIAEISAKSRPKHPSCESYRGRILKNSKSKLSVLLF